MVDERKGVDDEHEDIEKKVSIFHSLNGILAQTRNVISKKVFLSYRGFLDGGESNGLFENDFAAFFLRTRTFLNILSLKKNEGDLTGFKSY